MIKLYVGPLWASCLAAVVLVACSQAPVSQDAQSQVPAPPVPVSQQPADPEYSAQSSGCPGAPDDEEEQDQTQSLESDSICA